MVRFEDVYLYRFDSFGIPQWMPKDQATYYPTSKMAHAMKKLAKRYEGDRADVVVVKLRTAPSVGHDTEQEKKT